MQWSQSLWIRTFTSHTCVHAIESSDDGSQPSRHSVLSPRGEASGHKNLAKLFLHLKPRWRICQAFKSCSKKASNDATNNTTDGSDDSDVETFVSANSSELCSFTTDDNLEVPSFRLTPLIFPTGNISRPIPAFPVKIIRKLPFGYVIGRQDVPASPLPPSMTPARNIVKKVMPVLHVIRSRSKIVKKKTIRAMNRTFQRGGERGDGRGEEEEEEEDGDGCMDNEDVFWKKDVRGLRCRRVENEESLY